MIPVIDDRSIIQLLFDRSESGLAALDAKYGKLCRQLSYHILNDCRDAEECVNDAYLGVWNAIPPAEPDPLRAYVCKVVRNLSLKRYDKRKAKKRDGTYDVAIQELGDCLPAPDTVEGEVETRELARVIEGFLDTLEDRNLVIFLRRYWFSDTYAEIAERAGIPEKSVSMRLVRIRKQMKKYLMESGVTV